LRDRDIRRALHKFLSASHTGQEDTIIIEEMNLCQGEARIDVTVINGAIHGYEIKSDRDTLERLRTQEAVYNRTLDTVTIVASGAHLRTLPSITPSWWGIIEAKESVEGIELVEIRPALPNPSVDPEALVQLLWRNEALALLRERGLHKGVMSKPKRVLWQRLLEYIPSNELKDLVREQLKARTCWRVVEPQALSGDLYQPSSK